MTNRDSYFSIPQWNYNASRYYVYKQNCFMLYKKIVAIQKSPNLDIKVLSYIPKKKQHGAAIPKSTNNGETSTALYAK